MNGKFSKAKRVLAALVGVLMLISCMSVGAFALEISPEAVVFVKPEVVEVVSNQIGMNYVYVDIKTENAANDHPVVVYLTDAQGDLVTLAYAPVNANVSNVVLGVPDDAPTAKYNVIVAVNRAADVHKSNVFYIGVGDVTGFFEAINMTDVEVASVKEKLDLHYNALSVIECKKDDDGNVILKMTGEDYNVLSADGTENGKTAFAELILNGVNGQYSAGKGTYDAENSEKFVKDAYVVAAYNKSGMTDEKLAELIYKHETTIGFDAADENLYGKIQNKDNLMKVAKTIAPEVANVAELAQVLEKAACIQLVNETHWANLVAVVKANNDLFGVDEDEIEKLEKTKKLRNLFCEEFKGTYYSIEEIQEAWDDAYKAAKKEYDKKNDDKGSSSDRTPSVTGTVVKNDVYNQLSDPQNNKDPNKEITEYYTDMGDYMWTSDAVLNLTKAGIISGYGDKTFAPANSLTRAEFMKMIVNVFGFADITAKSTFTDVQADAWYYIYVASAEKLGIAQGYGDGKFGVNDPVTRQDAITIIYRAAKIKKLSLEKFNGSVDSLKDKDQIASYAKDAVAALYNTGVYLDASDPKKVDTFEPTRNATRAYIAVVLNEVYKYIVQ